MILNKVVGGISLEEETDGTSRRGVMMLSECLGRRKAVLIGFVQVELRRKVCSRKECLPESDYYDPRVYLRDMNSVE